VIEPIICLPEAVVFVTLIWAFLLKTLAFESTLPFVRCAGTVHIRSWSGLKGGSALYGTQPVRFPAGGETAKAQALVTYDLLDPPGSTC